jgi:hypothetical protein
MRPEDVRRHERRRRFVSIGDKLHVTPRVLGKLGFDEFANCVTFAGTSFWVDKEAGLASQKGPKGSGLFSRQLHSAATAVISRVFIFPVLPTYRPCPEVVSRPGEGAPRP